MMHWPLPITFLVSFVLTTAVCMGSACILDSIPEDAVRSSVTSADQFAAAAIAEAAAAAANGQYVAGGVGGGAAVIALIAGQLLRSYLRNRAERSPRPPAPLPPLDP